MLDQNDFPTVLFDDDGTFTDISKTVLDYARSSAGAVVVAAEDRLLFGRVKPFRSFYIETGTANTNSTAMTLKFFDNDTSAFKAVTDLLDETQGLTRSGFVNWDHVNTQEEEPWVKTTINGSDLYWVELTFSADFSAGTTIKGWNIVFSDDQDLNRIYDGATQFLRSGTDSGILYHETARRMIMNTLAREGKFKRELGTINNTSLPAQLDAWDLHDIEEVNLWSTFLALSLLFENVSTDPDDKFAGLADKYMREAAKAKKVFYLTIDTDDDGTRDREEALGSRNFSTGFVVRR